MGQKVNPYGFRLGITTEWKSRWFSDRQYKEYLTEDWTIRREIMTKLEKERVSLSVSSLRAYGLTEELLDEIQKVRATGLNFPNGLAIREERGQTHDRDFYVVGGMGCASAIAGSLPVPALAIALRRSMSTASVKLS